MSGLFLSTQAFDLAEARADIQWVSKLVSKLKGYVNGEHKYRMKFPDVRGFPEEEDLREKLKACIEASEQTIRTEMEEHLKAYEMRVKAKWQQLMSEKAEEMQNTHANGARPQQPEVSLLQQLASMDETQKAAVLQLLQPKGDTTEPKKEA